MIIIAINLPNYYGSEQNNSLAQGMVSILLNKAIARETTFAKGDSNRLNDKVNTAAVEDNIISALNSKTTRHIIYNVCTSYNTTYQETFIITTKIYKKDLDIKNRGSTLGNVLDK